MHHHRLRPSNRPAPLALFASLILIGCSGSSDTSSGGNGSGGSGGVGGGAGSRAPVVSCSDVDDPDDFFPLQGFVDNFDCGRAGNRWFGAWEAAPAGVLDPSRQAPEVVGSESEASIKQEAGSRAPTNYVMQSPDPMVSDGDRGASCTGFAAEFAEEGTFAFNYFVRTAEAIDTVPFSRNYLEVTVYASTVDSEGFPIDTSIESVWTADGQVSSRYFRTLPAGHYDFEFCYVRNRTVDLTGPDFVQIDDVETCAGTSCQGEIPLVPRCRVDQGQTVVPSLAALPTPTFELNRVQGTDDRYYLIVDLDFLDFIVGGLETLEGPRVEAIKAEIDGLRTQTLVDGETCDIDTRRSLLIEMSDDEFLDFLLETGLVADAFDALEQAFIEGAMDAVEGAIQRAVDAAIDKIEEKIGEQVAKFLGKMIGKLITKLV